MVVIEIQPKLLINGELREASDKKTFPLYNPATREKAADVPEASEDDANAAVAAAKAAFPAWSSLSHMERGEYMKKLAALMKKNKDKFAYLDAISMGKPIAIYTDAVRGAVNFDYYAAAWPQVQGQSSLNTPGHIKMTLRQPFGVAALIIPWNFPINFLSSKSAPALIMGNTVVVKASEKSPLSAALMAELVVEAGFPPGVFNILTGHGMPSGQVLSSHMDVRVLSFTGSSRTGRLIQQDAAKSNLKKVILELGGKTPAIIFEDANIEKAVKQTSASLQRNSGQVCMANSRIYVQRSILPKFIETFTKTFSTYKAGLPTEIETTLGPQADEMQYKHVMSYIEEGKQSGTLALGGNGMLDSMNGYYIEPTVFTDTPEDARIMKEEIFGPVVSVNAFDTEAEVIAKANDTEFGLYAAVYTKDLDRAMRMAKALESGYVGVNCTSPQRAVDAPFGGYKGSGQGREGWLHSMEEFTEEKTVLIQIEDA